MTRKSMAVWVVSTSALMGAAGGFVARSQDRGQKAIVVHQHETYFRNPTGEQVKIEESLFAVRRDGSEVTITKRVGRDGQVAEQKTVFDVGKREHFEVEGFTESVTTTPLSDAFVERLANPRRQCSNHPPQETGTFLGYRVQKTHIEKVLPDNKLLCRLLYMRQI